MKKIVFIADQNPFEKEGGVALVTRNIIDICINKYEVTCLCWGDSRKEYTEKNKRLKIIQIKRKRNLLFNDIFYALKIKNILLKLNPDLIIDNGAYSFLNYFLRKVQAKTLTICHGTNWGYFKTLKIKKPIDLAKYMYRIMWMFLQKKYVNNCYHIVAVSKKVRTELMGEFYNISDKKITVINNFSRFSIDEALEDKQIEKEFVKKGVFVSFQHDRKGIGIVENCAKALEDIEFLIVGQEYETKIPNIIYLGSLSSSKLEETMKNVDFLILPTLYEGQALSILEGLSLGLVCITTREGDPGYLNGQYSRFILPHDDVSFIDAIKELYSRPDIFKDLRKEGFSKRKFYDKSYNANLYLNLINKLLRNLNE